MAFSKTGVSCLQGPHHVAQKSTIIGMVIEASITSRPKVSIEASLIISAGGAEFRPAEPIALVPVLVLQLADFRVCFGRCRKYLRPSRISLELPSFVLWRAEPANCVANRLYVMSGVDREEKSGRNGLV